MHSALFLAAIAVVVLGLINGLPSDHVLTEGLQAWDDFVKTYKKVYANDEEYQIRKDQFLKNYGSLFVQDNQLSSQKSSYEVGINKFSDLSSEEFAQLYTSLPPSDATFDSSGAKTLLDENTIVKIPENFDWRLNNVLTAVKNTLTCGSSWAFTAIDSLEALFNRRIGAPINHLSEQYLVDCSTSNLACDGGWPHTALAHIQSNGAALELFYPYTGTKGACKQNVTLSYYTDFQLSRFTNVDSNTLLFASFIYGPFVVAIDARPLKDYKSGILNTTSCTEINHAVTLVGYVTSGPDAPYYILRNSWGSDWGEDGYFRLSALNDCMIKKYVVVVS